MRGVWLQTGQGASRESSRTGPCAVSGDVLDKRSRRILCGLRTLRGERGGRGSQTSRTHIEQSLYRTGNTLLGGMATQKGGLDMMRKNKNTDQAAQPAEDAPRSLVSRDSRDWFQDMDRWFDDLRTEFEREFWAPLAPIGRNVGLSVRVAPVDLADNGREYVLTAELPGVKKEDLDLRVTPDGLELAAQSSREREENGKDYRYRERSHESFLRRFAFPEEVLADKVEAKLQDGVLEARLPKKQPTPAHEPAKVQAE